MWIYEKKLEYPVHGEAGASFRYLSQRYSMKDRRVAGVLTDIGTEESAH